MNENYAPMEPQRADIDALQGGVVVEFGAPGCGFCKAAQPLIAAAFAQHPELVHFKIEDGKGRRLGRSFQVKLWPTLVFMKDGQEVARVVRPQDAATISSALAQIAYNPSVQ